jgi:hypothetical protein
MVRNIETVVSNGLDGHWAGKGRRLSVFGCFWLAAKRNADAFKGWK